MLVTISRWWRLRKRRLILSVLALLLFYYSFQTITRHYATEEIMSAVNLMRKVSLSIEPGKSTAILQPHSNNSCQETGEGLVLLIMIVSHPAHAKRRELIREVFREMRPFWEEHFQNERENALKGETVPNWIKNAKNMFKVLFFVGKSEKTSVLELKSESDKHGDLIMDDFQDTYLNLTVKSMRMLKWVTMNCPGASFILKLDDDVFLNIPKLISFLFSPPALENPGTLVAGSIFNETAPIRSPFSKWYTPEALYPRSEFPPYAAGYTYLLGMEAAKNIYKVALETPLFHMEDVFLTGLVAKEKIGYRLTSLGDIWKILYTKEIITWPSDHWYKKIVVHRVTPWQFRCWTILSTIEENEKITGECGWLKLILSAL